MEDTEFQYYVLIPASQTQTPLFREVRTPMWQTWVLRGTALHEGGIAPADDRESHYRVSTMLCVAGTDEAEEQLLSIVAG